MAITGVVGRLPKPARRLLGYCARTDTEAYFLRVAGTSSSNETESDKWLLSKRPGKTVR